jgi:predicted alpha/beta-fold hydrolase
MPLIRPSTYAPPRFLQNAHVQSIAPILVRRVAGINYQRTRIETPDNDFLDLDYSCVGSRRVGIVSHGLEGDSSRPYVLGMVRALNRRGWDAVAWNFRGCSGEPNRLLRFYHSGDSQDLHSVVTSVLARGLYTQLALIGFSLGGNITLKYLGERGPDVAPQIIAAAAFSVPCDLTSASHAMSRPGNAIYMTRFLAMLHQKIRWKMELFPEAIDDRGYRKIRTFKDFDDRYTAPLNGFQDAEDYWQKASSKPILANIMVPSLLVNAADDPFLAPACYPLDAALENSSLFLEVPPHGGHVGFVTLSQDGTYWSEQRATGFLETCTNSAGCDVY